MVSLSILAEAFDPATTTFRDQEHPQTRPAAGGGAIGAGGDSAGLNFRVKPKDGKPAANIPANAYADASGFINIRGQGATGLDV